jgi:hypothetical protein
MPKITRHLKVCAEEQKGIVSSSGPSDGIPGVVDSALVGVGSNAVREYPADADRAMTISHELNRESHAAAGTGPTWTCPKCDEVLESQFTGCRHRGTVRPALAPAG